MKRRVIWVLLSCLLATSLILASCAKSTTTSTPTSTTTSTSTPSTTTAATATTTTTTAAVTTTVTGTGNWWDYMGKPQYGGTMTISTSSSPTNWDPWLANGTTTGFAPYLEMLFCDKYTTDPSVFNFSQYFTPPEYVDGNLALSYEMPTPTSFIIHLRQNIYWQNIAPANGRQFTSADVVYHFNRSLGLGGGFTISPWMVGNSTWTPLKSVTAIDKYTVDFEWAAGTNPLFIVTNMQMAQGTAFECSDAVNLWGNLNDWHHAIGTGPYIMTDYVAGSSVTYTRNPTYWAYDMRYPQNQLPYIDKWVQLTIANNATAEAAFRTGKEDGISVTSTDAAAMMKTNPQTVEITSPAKNEISIEPRVDLAPFNDINVRIAMQHAIDIAGIAATFYQGNASLIPQPLTQNQMGNSGWGYPYSSWPQSLKDEWAYNPTLAKQILAAAGFPNGLSTNLLLQATNSVANGDLYLIIQSEFASIGINMSIQVIDDATWNSLCLVSNRTYPALCARTMGCTGMCTDPFTQLHKLVYGYSQDMPNVNDTKINAWYTQAMNATDIATVKQILYDENVYVAQQHFEMEIAAPNPFSLVQPWLKGVTGPNGIISSFLGPFPTGDWVDQNLKKSMGY